MLDRITATPDDDAPRLVYADWLQEHGADEKAEYIRAVVALSHPPEDLELVERCVELAAVLDAQWCQAVGGRFEVVIEGFPAALLFAHAFQTLMNLVVREPVRLWFPGEPVRLQAHLTREDAEAYVRMFPRLLPQFSDDERSRVRLFVRPMTAGPTLFAPGEPE